MNTNEIKVGTRVMKDGYEGTIVEVCSWDEKLVVVRLESGTACVAKNTFSGQYENNYIIPNKENDMNNLFERAQARVENSDKLAPHADFILADWNEGDEHLQWVITASESEILDWIEAGK